MWINHFHVKRSRDSFNNMIISLTGFMGCGKSSVGRKLSELLCCRFMDLDDCIVEEAGCSIPEIFAHKGEPAFRKLEKEVLSHIICMSSSSASTPASNVILALGGGAVMTEGSEEMVHEGTTCIYLKASVETLIEHLSGETGGRPLLSDGGSADCTEALRKRIEDLMSKRTATYERTAHIIIDTDGKSVDAVAQEIIKRL